MSNENARIRKVLVANRGEIARRIMRTCRDVGVATVAVFSDVDEDMPFVHEADEAVRIGPAPSNESYLSIEKIVEAAKRTGADAIHPGYGFLAENAAFAQACEDAGIVFIGPTPDAIRSMGSKQQAKRIVGEADVPVVPGYDGAKQDTETLAAEARKIGYPVLLKASAGGGGKGMRIVREDAQLEDAIEGARREGESSFGDGTLLIEKYIDSPRHVEIQILGDAYGNLVHLYERECSIQRRHQKIIEETPSPALDESLRRKMGEAAVEVGKAIGYRNAGTVEFILGPDKSFYFLEVNTRLQVEHPITEQVTGLDLVREQIRVAQGEHLGYIQDEIPFEGAAVECRIYAEDPANGFLPQSGPVVDWHPPEMDSLRIDGGVESGNEIGIHYDPMIAKVVTWGGNREEALQKMTRALGLLSVQGLTTNRAFLLQVLAHPEFLAGNFDTHFIDTHLSDALQLLPDEATVHAAAIAATLTGHEIRRREATILPTLPSGYRNNPFSHQQVDFEGPDGDVTVRYLHRDRGRFGLRIGDQEEDSDLRLISFETNATDTAADVTYELDGLRRRVRIVPDGDVWHTQSLGGAVKLLERPRFPDPSAEAIPGACVAPMPGKIIQLRVAQGDTVEQGQVLVVMEAMKMEHTVTAPQDGVVENLHVAEGEQVDADALLAVVKEAE